MERERTKEIERLRRRGFRWEDLCVGFHHVMDFLCPGTPGRTIHLDVRAIIPDAAVTEGKVKSGDDAASNGGQD